METSELYSTCQFCKSNQCGNAQTSKQPQFVCNVEGSEILIFFLVIHSFVNLQAHSSPLEDPDLQPEERKLIIGNSVSVEPVKTIPWRLILSKAPVWALIVSHFCHNWGTFILLTWMPTYYNQVRANIYLVMNLVQGLRYLYKYSYRGF